MSYASLPSLKHPRAVSASRLRDAERRAIVLLALAYLALRALLVWRLPIVYDEGQYAAEAQIAFDHPARETLLLAVRDGHGPLQSFFALGPIALGLSAIDAVRLLSVLAGAAGAAAVGLLATTLAGFRAGLIAAGLWIVLPFTLLYDALGLGDGLAAAAVAWAIVLALRLAARPSLRTGLLLGVVIALGILAKKSAAVALIVLPLSAFAFDWMQAQRTRRVLYFGAGLALAGGVAVCALLVPRLAPAHLRVLGDLAGAQQMHSFDQLFTNYAVLARGNAPVFNDAVTGYFGIPFLVVAVAGVALLLRRRQPPGAIVAACLLVPALTVYALAVTAYPRYLSVAVPSAIVVVAVALAAVPRPLLRAGLAVVALASPVWLTARMVWHPGDAPYPSIDRPQFVSEWPSGTPWPRMRAALVASTAPRQPVTTVAYHGVRFPPFGLAAEIGHPWFPVDTTGRSPSGVVYAERGGRRFVLRGYDEGTRPRFILEQPDSGAGRNWAHDRYALVRRYRRPGGDTVVTLWRRR